MQPVAKKQKRTLKRRWPLLAALAVLVVGILVSVILLQRKELETLPDAPVTSGVLFTYEPEQVASLRIQLRSGDDYTLLQDTAGELSMADDPDFPVSETYVSPMLSAVSTFGYDDVLAEDAQAYQEHWTEYGLDAPQVVAEITYTDGTAVTLRIGNASPVEEETWYYMTVDGDDRLFAVDKGTAEDLMTSRASLWAVEQPTLHAARLDEITLTDANGSITAQWRLKGAITDSDAASNWYMTIPYAYPADESSMTTLRKNLSNLRLGAYVGEATSENLTAYGLDAPQQTLTLHMAAGTTGRTDEAGVYSTVDWPESTFCMKVGSAKSDVVDYVQVEDKIYLCSHFSLAVFRDLEPQSTLSRYPLMVTLDDAISLTVTTAAGTDTYQLTREEQVAENNELVTDSEGNVQYDYRCEKNGKEISYDAFAAAWEQLAAVRVTGWLPTGYQSTEAAHTTLTITTVSGKVHTIELAKYDALHDAVIVDGTALFYLIAGGVQFDVA